MRTRAKSGLSMAVVGLAVFAYDLATGVPAFRLVGPEGLFTTSGAIYSPLLSYVFAVVLVVVGTVVSFRNAS